MRLLLVCVVSVLSVFLVVGSSTQPQEAKGGLDAIRQHLDHILRVRVSGTPSNFQVRDYIISQFNGTRWEVETDQFYGSTPQGTKSFTNIVATFKRSSPKRIIVACHYDSKYFQTFDFLGAIDSACSCALMLKWSRDLSQDLELHPSGYSLQLIFFDGEEAFQFWSHTDSTYGSRHLAELWKQQPEARNSMKNIHVFTLLDLLGAANPQIPGYFSQTAVYHRQLYNIELQLRNSMGLSNRTYILADNGRYYSPIEDDHLPFLNSGVPILHLIPYPFPNVWHRSSDNRSALDDQFVTLFDKIFYHWLETMLFTS